MFIKLTQDDSSKVLVNPEAIISIQEVEAGSLVGVAGRTMFVSEPVDIVEGMVEGRHRTALAFTNTVQAEETEAFRLLVANCKTEAIAGAADEQSTPFLYAEMAEDHFADEMQNVAEETPEYLAAESEYLAWMQTRKSFAAAAN